jgi:hypothetical protein
MNLPPVRIRYRELEARGPPVLAAGGEIMHDSQVKERHAETFQLKKAGVVRARRATGLRKQKIATEPLWDDVLVAQAAVRRAAVNATADRWEPVLKARTVQGALPLRPARSGRAGRTDWATMRHKQSYARLAVESTITKWSDGWRASFRWPSPMSSGSLPVSRWSGATPPRQDRGGDNRAGGAGVGPVLLRTG